MERLRNMIKTLCRNNGIVNALVFKSGNVFINITFIMFNLAYRKYDNVLSIKYYI